MERGLEGVVVLFRMVSEEPLPWGEVDPTENRLEGGSKTFRYLERVFQTEGVASTNILGQAWPICLRKNRRATKLKPRVCKGLRHL